MLTSWKAVAASIFSLLWITFPGNSISSATELLSDPSFEDPIEIEDGEQVDSQWGWVNGDLPMPTVNATSDPLSGAEHAQLVLDTSQLFTPFGPTIRSTAYAGTGAAAALTDFTGETLTVTNNYKVTSFNVNSPDPEVTPAIAVRTYLAYFSDVFGFLGFGGISGDPFLSDQYPEGISADYLTTSYSVEVPNFGTPVTSVDFTIGLIALTTEMGQMTGTATVIFDDVSLDLGLGITSDFNGNGIVDAADYTIWRDLLGTTDLEPYDPGDADGDGDVTDLDFDIWREQFGQTVPVQDLAAGLAATTVPEPASALSLSLGATILLSIRRRLSRAIEVD